jgi:hypothetical protein
LISKCYRLTKTPCARYDADDVFLRDLEMPEMLEADTKKKTVEVDLSRH